MFFFFFKQKTAYELRISDWSSDVCSSDLKVGKLLAHDEDSYRYLIESIRRFPDMPTFERMIAEAGFVNTHVEPMLGGLVAIHSGWKIRSEEHTSELQSLMRISYAVFCLKKKKQTIHNKSI